MAADQTCTSGQKRRVDAIAEERLQEWMAAYQAGDPQAFERLYGFLLPQLRAYLTTLTRDRAHAEDLVQDCFLQIHRSRHTYLPARPVRPWVFAIARHVFRAQRRGRTRRERRESRFAIPSSFEAPDIDRLADREQLETALARVSSNRRETLVLHHAFGFSFAEIGKVLNIRAGTAKVRAHRGMVELREILNRKSLS